MRSSLLTRSAVTVATLAIGSVTLAAAPASADTVGTSRLTVLSIADGERTGGPFSNDDDVDALVEKVCAIGDAEYYYGISPTYEANGVDGFLVQAAVRIGDTDVASNCTFAAFAATRPSSTMSGTATISLREPAVIDAERLVAADAAPRHDFALSGEVYVTAPVDDIGYEDAAIATASGAVTTTEASTSTTSRVVTPKSTERKRAAYKAYNRTLDKAQAKLAKALKKADGSSKKTAARKAYAARKKAALAKRHAALDGTKTTVVRTVPQTSTKAFTFTTDSPRV